MAEGVGRRVGAWLMLVGAVLFVLGVVVVTRAVFAFERQVADLDESQARAEVTLATGVVGLGGMAVGLLVFLVAWIVFGVGSVRARRRGWLVERGHGVVAGVAGAAVVAALLFVVAWPGGPVMLVAGFAEGGGGPAGSVQLVSFEGNLTSVAVNAAPAAGPVNDVDVHSFEPVAAYGALKMRLLSGGAPGGTFAVAVLEMRESGGDWEELARTEPQGDSEVALSPRGFPGELRFRVLLPQGSAGYVEYGLVVSFDPR